MIGPTIAAEPMTGPKIANADPFEQGVEGADLDESRGPLPFGAERHLLDLLSGERDADR